MKPESSYLVSIMEREGGNIFYTVAMTNKDLATILKVVDQSKIIDIVSITSLVKFIDYKELMKIFVTKPPKNMEFGNT